MLIGFNTNVPFKGKVYHVQTEDSGLTNPFIITHLYHQGAILHSVKTGYAQIVGTAGFEEQLRNLMKHQHREMIRALIKGNIVREKTGDDEGCSPETKESDKVPEERKNKGKRHAKSLDEILLEHISRKVEK